MSLKQVIMYLSFFNLQVSQLVMLLTLLSFLLRIYNLGVNLKIR